MDGVGIGKWILAIYCNAGSYRQDGKKGGQEGIRVWNSSATFYNHKSLDGFERGTPNLPESFV